MAVTRLAATCACGKVRIAVDAAPMLVSICHCDDCQAAAQRVEALPGAPPVRDAYGGTGLTLVPPDRMRVVAGSELLQPFKLRPGSPTNRYVAACCNSLMSIDFDRGPFWASLVTDRIAPPRPIPTIRVQTRHVPAGVALPDDMPASAGYPFVAFFGVLREGFAMFLRRIFRRR